MLYFISYNSSKGPGRCEVSRDYPIKSVEDIERLELSISENNGAKHVIINNFKELQNNFSEQGEAVQTSHNSASMAIFNELSKRVAYLERITIGLNLSHHVRG